MKSSKIKCLPWNSKQVKFDNLEGSLFIITNYWVGVSVRFLWRKLPKKSKYRRRFSNHVIPQTFSSIERLQKQAIFRAIAMGGQDEERILNIIDDEVRTGISHPSVHHARIRSIQQKEFWSSFNFSLSYKLELFLYT